MRYVCKYITESPKYLNTQVAAELTVAVPTFTLSSKKRSNDELRSNELPHFNPRLKDKIKI